MTTLCYLSDNILPKNFIPEYKPNTKLTQLGTVNLSMECKGPKKQEEIEEVEEFETEELESSKEFGNEEFGTEEFGTGEVEPEKKCTDNTLYYLLILILILVLLFTKNK